MTVAMMHETATPGSTGRVLLTHGTGNGDGHEAATHKAAAARLAALLDLPYAGAFEDQWPRIPSYIVPRATLSGAEVATQLAIRSEGDLFGGWVPHAWMATKAIMHPLVSPQAHAPAGWPHRLAEEALPLTLRGITAFSAEDARAAGRQLVRSGPVRLKPANADGGRGQVVASDEAGIDEVVAAACTGGRLNDIVTLEENLEEVDTFSVGQVRLPGSVASYCGTQVLTGNGQGSASYGGSALLVVRGGFDRLLAWPLPAELKDAIRQAVAFDRLADRHLPGLIASRRNYDVASGVTSTGSRRLGVLEQSWRPGGATGAEIAALEIFAREPKVDAVRARTVEVYGEAPPLPEGATLYYRGDDPTVGRITKYACVEEKIEG